MTRVLLPLFTLLCILLFSINASSQVFRPGFIVQAEGDTIRGLIKYRESYSNYKSCVFKQDKNATATEYIPDQIIAFGITNDALFESKDLIDAKGKSFRTFAEVLVHGNLNLYQYKNLFFLEKEKGDLKPLKVESEEVSTGQGMVLKTSAKHLILINSLTFDCPVPEELMVKIQKGLNVPATVAVVEAYNNCIEPNSSISYKANKPWMAVEKGILLGGHSTTLNFGGGPYSIKDAKFPSANNVVFGGYLNITSPRKSESLSFHVETFYSKEQHVGYLELQGPLILLKNDYTIDIKRLSVVSMARYTYRSNNKVSPYLAIGMSSNGILTGKGLRRLETETTINDTEQIETYISETYLNRKFYVSATAAIGTNYSFNDKHKVLLQFRYEKGRYVSGKAISHPDFTAHLDNNNSFYLTAAYIIK